jgi:hypothetical protein
MKLISLILGCWGLREINDSICCDTYAIIQGLMHVNGRPVAAFDPEGLIFGAGIDAEYLKLYDLRSFDRVSKITATFL